MIIYGICLVFGLMFTLVSDFLGHCLADMIPSARAAPDAGFDSDGVPGITFFSPTVLASFITAFGAFGLIFSEIHATSSVWLHAPISFIAALSVSILSCG